MLCRQHCSSRHLRRSCSSSTMSVALILLSDLTMIASASLYSRLAASSHLIRHHVRLAVLPRQQCVAASSSANVSLCGSNSSLRPTR